MMLKFRNLVLLLLFGLTSNGLMAQALASQDSVDAARNRLIISIVIFVVVLGLTGYRVYQTFNKKNKDKDSKD